MDDVLLILDAAALSDVGRKRQRNEDTNRMLLPPPDADQAALGALYVVADGMGGLGGGDVASRIGADELVRGYYETSAKSDPESRLRAALQYASVQVSQQAPRIGLPRIGATAAGMVIQRNGEALVFNVGDARVYRVRGGQIERLSHDQSLMEQQIEAGMSASHAAEQTNSSLVTGFLGQPVQLQPEIRREQTDKGDVYVICSDGLWSLLDASEIKRAVRTKPVQAGSRQLIQMALKRGAPDNVTVIVIRIGKPPRFVLRSTFGLLAAAFIIVALFVVFDILLWVHPR
jgi:serine/threonine protein phosphatase PrpC